jgi:hypothetical protein
MAKHTYAEVVTGVVEDPAIVAEEGDVTEPNELEMASGFHQNVQALENKLENIEKEVLTALEEMPEGTERNNKLSALQADVEDCEEKLNFCRWQYGCLFKLEDLIAMRTFFGKASNMYNFWQEFHYKAQNQAYKRWKAEWETAHPRAKFNYFKLTEEQRQFIEEHKARNEHYSELMWFTSDQRSFIANIIDAAYPDAPFDHGLGPEEDFIPHGEGERQVSAGPIAAGAGTHAIEWGTLV